MSILNVRDFGAAGDGKPDDAPAIQRALDAAQPGGTVYLPAGQYWIEGPLVVPSGAQVVGDGLGTVILSPLDGPAIRSDGRTDGALISGMRISAIGAVNDESIGIDATNWNRATIRRVEIDGMALGVLLDAPRGSSAYNSLLDQVHINGREPEHRSVGVRITGEANECTVRACRLVSCATAVQVAAVTNTTLIGNELAEFFRVGLDVVGGGRVNGVSVVGGRFETTQPDAVGVIVGSDAVGVALINPFPLLPGTFLDDASGEVMWLSPTRVTARLRAGEVGFGAPGTYATTVALAPGEKRTLDLLNRQGGGLADLRLRRLVLENYPMIRVEPLNGDPYPPERGGILYLLERNGMTELRVKFPTGAPVVVASGGAA